MCPLLPPNHPRLSMGGLAFAHTLSQLGWAKASSPIADIKPQSPADVDNAELAGPISKELCLLESCLRSSNISGFPIELTRLGSRHLTRLHELGVSVYEGWPRSWRTTIDTWIGSRLYIGHRRFLEGRSPLVSLVSSRLGKAQQQLPHWPTLLQRALESIKRRQETLLLVRSSASDVIARPFARRFDLPCVELQVAHPHSPSATQWLTDNFEQLLRKGVREFAADVPLVAISPALDSPVQCIDQSSTIAGTPLQDRLLVALGDRVIVLHVRKGGSVERLITQRLEDAAFPCASLFVTLKGADSPTKHAANSWLEKGGVGWYSPTGGNSLSELSCRFAGHAPGVRQSTAPLRLNRTLEQDDSSDSAYLVHCTRGSSGPGPDESWSQYQDRIFLQGEIDLRTPLLSLIRILRQRCIMGSERMFRTNTPMISFSAVPLPSLLARRTFQVHLNRWDWEPYGLLIRREILRERGAKPVIYGGEEQYLTMTDDQRCWFQPSQRKGAGQLSWSDEREWRIRGDLWLSQLPYDSIIVFVRTEQEANFVAKESPWPVIWIESL